MEKRENNHSINFPFDAAENEYTRLIPAYDIEVDIPWYMNQEIAQQNRRVVNSILQNQVSHNSEVDLPNAFQRSRMDKIVEMTKQKLESQHGVKFDSEAKRSIERESHSDEILVIFEKSRLIIRNSGLSKWEKIYEMNSHFQVLVEACEFTRVTSDVLTVSEKGCRCYLIGENQFGEYTLKDGCLFIKIEKPTGDYEYTSLAEQLTVDNEPQKKIDEFSDWHNPKEYKYGNGVRDIEVELSDTSIVFRETGWNQPFDHTHGLHIGLNILVNGCQFICPKVSQLIIKSKNGKIHAGHFNSGKHMIKDGNFINEISTPKGADLKSLGSPEMVSRIFSNHDYIDFEYGDRFLVFTEHRFQAREIRAFRLELGLNILYVGIQFTCLNENELTIKEGGNQYTLSKQYVSDNYSLRNGRVCVKSKDNFGLTEHNPLFDILQPTQVLGNQIGLNLVNVRRQDHRSTTRESIVIRLTLSEIVFEHLFDFEEETVRKLGGDCTIFAQGCTFKTTVGITVNVVELDGSSYSIIGAPRKKYLLRDGKLYNTTDSGEILDRVADALVRDEGCTSMSVTITPSQLRFGNGISHSLSQKFSISVDHCKFINTGNGKIYIRECDGVEYQIMCGFDSYIYYKLTNGKLYANNAGREIDINSLQRVGPIQRQEEKPQLKKKTNYVTRTDVDEERRVQEEGETTEIKDNTPMCPICEEYPAHDEVYLDPCGHSGYCMGCSFKQVESRECWTCRSVVKKAKKMPKLFSVLEKK